MPNSSSIKRLSLAQAGAVLISQVRGGARTVVGAGAIVTKDIPNDVTVVGNPAKII